MKIIPLEMNDGDPGYLAEGHVDKEEFMRLAALYEDAPKNFKQSFTEPEYGWHIKATSEDEDDEDFPCPSGYDEFYYSCSADEPGAIPTTFTRTR